MTQNGSGPVTANQEDIERHFDRSPQCMTDLHNIALQRQLAEAQAKIAELTQEKELVER